MASDDDDAFAAASPNRPLVSDNDDAATGSMANAALLPQTSAMEAGCSKTVEDEMNSMLDAERQYYETDQTAVAKPPWSRIAFAVVLSLIGCVMISVAVLLFTAVIGEDVSTVHHAL